MKGPSLTRYFALAILLLVCSACESTQVARIGSQSNFTKEADEARLWERTEESQEVILHSGYINNDPGLNEYLNGVLQKIVPSDVKAAGAVVKVYVLNDPAFNAFMMANGSFFIHTGLLAGLENEAQLVTVLGHELTHFIDRHSLKQFRNIKNTSAFYSTISALSIAAPGGAIVSLSSLLVSLSFISSVYGYSRDLEHEADKGSFAIMINNGYDVTQAPKAFDILAQFIKDDKIKQPYFFSTHPRVKERMESFKELCAENKASVGKQGNILNEDTYGRKIEPLLLPNALANINCNRFKMAQRGIERYTKNKPQDPEGYYCMGKLFNSKKEKGDIEKAIENYMKAIELDAGYARSYRELGFICYKNKQTQEAREYFERYLALSSNPEDRAYIEKYVEELRKN